MKPLPAVVVTKLKTAAAKPKGGRTQAINESVKWAKKHFPEYFLEDISAKLPPIKTYALELYLEKIKRQLILEDI